MMRMTEVVKDETKVEISSAESFCSTSQFLTHSSSLDTSVNAKVFTQKEDYAVVTQACFFTLSFRVVSSLHMWGMAINLLGVWSKRHTFIVRKEKL